VQKEAGKSSNGRLTKTVHLIIPQQVQEHEILVLDSRLAWSVCQKRCKKEKHQVVVWTGHEFLGIIIKFQLKIFAWPRDPPWTVLPYRRIHQIRPRKNESLRPTYLRSAPKSSCERNAPPRPGSPRRRRGRSTGARWRTAAARLLASDTAENPPPRILASRTRAPAPAREGGAGAGGQERGDRPWRRGEGGERRGRSSEWDFLAFWRVGFGESFEIWCALLAIRVGFDTVHL
jgi:hypothetical protein